MFCKKERRDKLFMIVQPVELTGYAGKSQSGKNYYSFSAIIFFVD